MPKCYLTPKMLALFNRQKVGYVKQLVLAEKEAGLSPSEYKCNGYINACVEEFKDMFKSDFLTTPYGEGWTIMNEEDWAKVSRI